MRFDDQKENDQAAKEYELKMLGGHGLKSKTVDPVSYTHLTLPTIYSV